MVRGETRSIKNYELTPADVLRKKSLEIAVADSGIVVIGKQKIGDISPRDIGIIGIDPPVPPPPHIIPPPLKVFPPEPPFIPPSIPPRPPEPPSTVIPPGVDPRIWQEELAKRGTFISRRDETWIDPPQMKTTMVPGAPGYEKYMKHMEETKRLRPVVIPPKVKVTIPPMTTTGDGFTKVIPPVGKDVDLVSPDEKKNITMYLLIGAVVVVGFLMMRR